MKNKDLARKLGISVLGTLSFAAGAQVLSTPVKPTYEIGGAPRTEGPRGVDVGEGVVFFPYAHLNFGRDDNMFLSNANKQASNFTVFNPGFKLVTRGEIGQLILDYDGKFGFYNSSRDDDYRDQQVGAVAEVIASGSAGFRFNTLYSQGHDPRGSTDRSVSTEPDKYEISGGGALFAYGANSARGRIEFEAGEYKRHYINNRATTFLSDRKNDALAGRFFARVAPKTSLVLEVRDDKFDYDSAVSQFDSRERRYLVGVTWDATAQTSGTIKVGQIRKDFVSPVLLDYSGTGWEANVRWAPLTYSTVDIFTSKSFTEATGLGDYILTKRYGANWNHGWSSRFSTGISLLRVDDAYSGFGRDDKSTSLGLKVGYKILRTISIGAEVTHTKRDSNISTFDYKRNIYMLTLGATL